MKNYFLRVSLHGQNSISFTISQTQTHVLDLYLCICFIIIYTWVTPKFLNVKSGFKADSEKCKKCLEAY